MWVLFFVSLLKNTKVNAKNGSSTSKSMDADACVDADAE